MSSQQKEQDETQREIQENRKKLAEKMGAQRNSTNTARRKHKNVSKTTINDDKKLKQVIKKLGVQPFPGVDEVNFFKDDNTIIHFERPEVQAAIQSNTFAVFGNPQTKNFKDLMPEIIQHIGPKQFGLLQNLMKQKDTKGGVNPVNEATQEDEDEDVPNLVGGQQNFEEASK